MSGLTPDAHSSAATDDSDSVFRALFAASIDAVLITAPDGRIISANPAACVIFRCTLEELYRLGRSGVVDASDPRLQTALVELERCRSFRGALTFVRSSGETFTGELSTAYFYNKNGEPRTSMQIRDITAHKLADQAQQHLAAIINSSDDAVIAKTLDGVISSWNHGAERLFGYSAEQAIGQSMQMLFPSERTNEEKEILAAICRGEKVTHFETVRIHRDGRRIDVSSTISPIIDAGGRIIGASNIARDITKQMQTQAALRESEQRFRMAIAALQEGFVMHDGSGAIVACNASAERLLGLSAEQIMGRTSLDPFWHMVHEDGSNFLGETHPAMVSLREGIAQHNVVMGIHRSSGELAWISVNSVPIRLSENNTAVVVTLRDITALRQAEAERDRLINELQTALGQVKKLSGILPICSGCKKIRDRKTNTWESIDSFITRNSEAHLSHGMCPECIKRYFPGVDISNLPK